jgi:CRP-like cAMP-binding protein
MVHVVLLLHYVNRATNAVLERARLNHILNALPDGTLRRILSGTTLKDLPRGRRLYREDGPVEALYFPIHGVVSILTRATESRDTVMATVGNEGAVGISVAMGIPRALGRKIVQVAGQAIMIGAKRFEELLRVEQQLSLVMHRYLYAFVREVLQACTCNRLHTMEERCARWLLMAHDRAGTDQFALTQDFLAEMLGTRRANVNLALAMFRRAGAVQYVYRRITVIDRNLLESLSCPCYRLIHQAHELVKI